jgi:hypothetical protein
MLIGKAGFLGRQDLPEPLSGGRKAQTNKFLARHHKPARPGPPTSPLGLRTPPKRRRDVATSYGFAAPECDCRLERLFSSVDSFHSGWLATDLCIKLEWRWGQGGVGLDVGRTQRNT